MRQFTPTEQERKVLLEALRKGATHRLACSAAGVSASPFQVAFNQGRDDTAAGVDSEEAKFFAEVSQAEWFAAEHWLDVIEDAMVTDWKAAAWKLERRHPQDFGKSVVENQGAIVHKVVIDLSSLSDEELNALSNKLIE
jgi:hypothetical protein